MAKPNVSPKHFAQEQHRCSRFAGHYGGCEGQGTFSPPSPSAGNPVPRKELAWLPSTGCVTGTRRTIQSKETLSAQSITQSGRNKEKESQKDLKIPSVQLPEQQVTDEKLNHQNQIILILHLQKQTASSHFSNEILGLFSTIL